jgi:hypothetical protein
MTKLILVEGIPGSGKTNTAQYITSQLSSSGIETALFLEGDWDHPADFESVACLDTAQVQELKNRFPQHVGFLDSQVRVQDGDHFFSYQRIAHENHGQIPPALVEALSIYEIYEQPVEKFRRLLLKRWREFAASAAQGTQVYIFECCFLQNPLTFYLGRNDESLPDTQAFVLELAHSIQFLEPRLIYLHPGEVAATLQRVAAERPPEWLDLVIGYHTQQGHGLAQGWQGFEGAVKFYQMRQSIELDLLPEIPFPTLCVKHTTWEQDYVQIEQFLVKM